MTRLADPARVAHPTTTRQGEWLDISLAPLAAELVGCLRDYGPDDTAAVLARIPHDQHEDFVLVLAAMIDPDQHPGELLDWTRRPARSRDGREPAQQAVCPDCGRILAARHLGRHRSRKHRAEWAA